MCFAIKLHGEGGGRVIKKVPADNTRYPYHYGILVQEYLAFALKFKAERATMGETCWISRLFAENEAVNQVIRLVGHALEACHVTSWEMDEYRVC